MLADLTTESSSSQSDPERSESEVDEESVSWFNWRIRANSKTIHSDNPGNKVITTMVIRLLDDPTWCARSVIVELGSLSLGGRGVDHVLTR